VRRLSAPQHAGSLMSALFRDPFPRVGASFDRGRNSVMLTVFRRNSPAFRPNPHLSGHFLPAVIPGTRRFLRDNISSENPVTSCISMKTLIKLRKRFFPSCIMDLGALASPEWAACGDTPGKSHIHSCAGFMRLRLVSTLPFAAPRIFGNKLFGNKLFDNCIKST